MRVFGVGDDNHFTEYRREPFKIEHMEQTLEEWLEQNPRTLLDESELLFIGRQVPTNLGTFADLIAVDVSGAVVVIELKRDRTPRDTLAQALGYAAFVGQLEYDQLERVFQDYLGEESSLADYHRAYFEYSEDQGVSFNKEQRVVLVASDITPEIRQTAEFLRKYGLQVECIEFAFFRAPSGERLLSTRTVVGGTIRRIDGGGTARLKRVDRDSFLAACDPAGRSVFEPLLDACEQHNLPIHWGTRGCSLNADLEGVHVPILFCYPPTAVYGQSVFSGTAYIVQKVRGGDVLADQLFHGLDDLGPFKKAGQELKLSIDQQTPSQVSGSALTALFLDIVTKVVEAGVVE